MRRSEKFGGVSLEVASLNYPSNSQRVSAGFSGGFQLESAQSTRLVSPSPLRSTGNGLRMSRRLRLGSRIRDCTALVLNNGLSAFRSGQALTRGNSSSMQFNVKKLEDASVDVVDMTHTYESYDTT
jgi:hypothetical protein